MTENGMVPADEWAGTSVHKASSYYCGKCGEKFDSPDLLYKHLDLSHPKKTRSKR